MRISDAILNRLTVLKAIRRDGPVARSELPGLTGLSGGTITQLTAGLLERGLIRERKDAARRNGRPRTWLEIDADGAMVVGASLRGVGKLNVSFVDLAGERKFSLDTRLEGLHGSLEANACEIGEKLAQLIDSGPVQKDRICRVALAMPAVVDSGRGNVHFMTTFPADAAPVGYAAPIAARIGLPVTIENDISCMARAEHWFGRARDLESFTLIYAGLGIGSAAYADGLPKFGTNGLNPEIGHVKIATGNAAKPCFCGGRGCLSAHASIYGLLQTAGLVEDIPFPSIGALRERFDAWLGCGGGEVDEALEQAGHDLGLALANLITASDPGNILIVVSDARYRDAIEAPLLRALREHIMPGMLAATMIRFVLEEPEWRWKGTAALALEQTYLGVAS